MNCAPIPPRLLTAWDPLTFLNSHLFFYKMCRHSFIHNIECYIFLRISGIICNKLCESPFTPPRDKCSFTHFSCVLIPKVCNHSLAFVYVHVRPLVIMHTLPGNVFNTEKTVAQCLMLTNQDTHSAHQKGVKKGQSELIPMKGHSVPDPPLMCYSLQ